MKLYQEGLTNIQAKLNGQKDLEISERLELINQLFESPVTVDEKSDLTSIEDFFDSEQFKFQINPKSKHKRTEEQYHSIGLSNIADYLLDEWESFEGKNEELKDNTVWSRYEIARGRQDRESKRVIGFNSDVVDDYLTNGLPASVKKGYAVHSDKVDQFNSEEIHKVSEKEKLKQRKQQVLENLENHPELKESYDAWKEIGLQYGFDTEEYTSQERSEIQNKWIKQFEQEEHSFTPQKRLYDIRKHYNDMGYGLHTILKNVKQTIKVKKTIQPQSWIDYDDEIGTEFNLSEKKHVAGLLKVDYDQKNKEYLPIYYILHNDYKDKIDSSVYGILNKLDEVLGEIEFSEVERDILDLLLDRHNEFTIYNQACTVNPYKVLTKYINEIHNLKKSKGQIIDIIENKISSLIASTYHNITIGTMKIKCNKCESEKFASLENFGIDTRNKTMFKSTCKKCLAAAEKNRKKLA